MKTAVSIFLGLALAAEGWAASNVNSTNRYAYAANAGWLDARSDGTNGAVIGQYVCSKYLYAANLGWISLGQGSPINGIYYSNAATNDWGVNNLGDGRLRGYAYGANIGWLNFETNGDPRINLLTGRFSGYAWSANVGWISLSNAAAHVQADAVVPGADADGDGIPDAWELQMAGDTTTLNGTGDYDGDGVSDLAEYYADTQPRSASDNLHLSAFARAGATNAVSWPAKSTRLYQIEHAAAATNAAAWGDAGFGTLSFPAPVTATVLAVDPSSTTRFYRARASVPLSP
jgi:hypothetical protein